MQTYHETNAIPCFVEHAHLRKCANYDPEPLKKIVCIFITDQSEDVKKYKC